MANATIRSFLKTVPVLGPALVRLRGGQIPFKTSSDYWEARYRSGGTSGSGSYSRLAEFKASFLNQFVAEYNVRSIIEFGCGDGAQLQLARYPAYVGVDVAPTSIRLCREEFQGDTAKTFFTSNEFPSGVTADLTLSLDVIYHLVEDDTFDRYMQQLFDAAGRFVVIYASNFDKRWHNQHVRHRQFTDWVTANRPDWPLTLKTPNQYPFDATNPEQTSFADFYMFSKIS